MTNKLSQLNNSSVGHGWIASLIMMAIAAATFLVFYPAQQGDFLNWDDQSYVTQNDYVRGGLTKAGVNWAFTSSHSANWHPITWISHMLDVQFFGMKPTGHHVTSLVLHATNSALLFLLLRLITGSIWRSAIAAALFALHPLRVESVAWVAERKDVLSTFFGLMCLIAYSRYVSCRRGQKSRTAGAAAKLWYCAAFMLLALGLMSKPMLVTWPFVMLLLDVWPLGRIGLLSGVRSPESIRQLWKLVFEKSPFFALAVVSCVVTIIVQQRGGAVASFEHLPLGFRLQNAAAAYVEYLSKFFWPTNLSPIYPHPVQIEWWRTVFAVTVLGFVTVVAWIRRQSQPFILIGWLWFLGTLVPVLGIIQVGSQAFADRYTYIPMIGIAVAVVSLAGAIMPRLHLPKAVILAISMGILGTLGWQTQVQLAYWKNTETLFRYTLRLSPDNVQALYGLGSYLVDHGQTQEGKRLLEQTIRLQPTFAEAIGTLASALDGEGRYAEAVRYYEDALKAQPNHPGVLNNFAWLLASCPDAALRNGPQAAQYATRACELTGYSRPVFIGTLAAAQAEAGDFQTAIATAERAANLSSALRLDATAWRNRELIEFYRRGKAAHGGLPKAK